MERTSDKESPGVAFARAGELQKRQMPLRHEVESTGMDLTRPTLSGRAAGLFDPYQFDADFSRLPLLAQTQAGNGHGASFLNVLLKESALSGSCVNLRLGD